MTSNTAAHRSSPRRQQPPVGLAQPARRNTFSLRSLADGKGREHHIVTMPLRGVNRERARETIMKLLARADTKQHRVAFVITYRDGSRFTLGSKGGYDPARAALQSRIEQNDPIAWLAEQLHDQHPPQHATAIIGVDIDTWPRRPETQ